MTIQIGRSPLIRLLARAGKITQEHTQELKNEASAILVQQSAAIATRAQIEREASATRAFLASTPMQVIGFAVTAKSLVQAGCDVASSMSSTPESLAPDVALPESVALGPEAESVGAAANDFGPARILEESISRSKDFVETRLGESLEHATARAKKAGQVAGELEKTSRSVEAELTQASALAPTLRTLLRRLAQSR
ncbi:MAG: hypothetical protein HY791_15560 [Deltaproteobacteria bacterium]|nr:hypothetical protein [Deltaproteobacteria bacterium]